jgi:outer membrane protein assembly factor BamD
MRFAPRFLAVLCLALGAGCASSQEQSSSPLEYAESAKLAYERALAPYFDHDWEEATLRFTEVKRKFGYSRYARLAELRLADVAYHQEKYAEAITAYKAFVHDYPNDAEVAYARFRIARAQFDQTEESPLMPPLEERDLAAAHDAYETIQSFVSDYPRDPHRAELEYMQAMVGGLLARHELYVARYYLRQDRFPAAAARVEYALKHYQGSGLEPEALVLLGEIRLKLHQPDRARALFRKVLARYPDSAFIVPARRFLVRMGQRVVAD